MKILELLAVKIENSILKLQQLQHVAEPLQVEQRRLIEEARISVGASELASYNAQTQSFEEPNAPETS